MWRPDFAVRCCAKDPTILDELSEVIWLPRLDQSCEVLVLYRKREEARRAHERDVFARFRYNDLKEAGRAADAGRYAN
jgi:hypothetical protein